MKPQLMTRFLLLTGVLTLTIGCDVADKTSHDCQAIAKAISQNDKSSLRSEYDELMYESISYELPHNVRESYSRSHAYCAALDQGRL